MFVLGKPAFSKREGLGLGRIVEEKDGKKELKRKKQRKEERKNRNRDERKNERMILLFMFAPPPTAPLCLFRFDACEQCVSEFKS